MHPRALLVHDDGRARTPWRLLVFGVATLCAATFVSAVVYPALAWTPLVPFARQWGIPLDQLGAVVAVLLATYVTRRLVDRAGPRAWSGGGTRARDLSIWEPIGLGRGAWRWRTLALGVVMGTLAILVPCAVLLAAHRFALERQPELMSWWVCAWRALFLLAPAAFVEEVAFRGYPLTVLREAFGVPVAVAVTSMAFALLHLLNPGPSLLSVGMVALAGVFLAGVRLATGSLVAASLAHFAWNFTQAALLHAPVSGLPLPTPGYRLADHGPVWLTGGSWGPEGGVAAAAGMLLAIFLLVLRPLPGTLAGDARAPLHSVES